jgi:integrase
MPLTSTSHETTEQHKHPKYSRLTLLRHTSSRFYQARTFLDGKLVQKSTKTDHLPTAFKLGEDWYKKLLRASVTFGRKHPIDRLTTNPTVAEVYASYLSTLPKQKAPYAEQKWSPIADFWRTLLVRDITPQTFREFYTWRRSRSKPAVSNHTLHKDVVLIRQVLKFALEQEQIERLPVIPRIGPIVANPRPWLNNEEWERLQEVARDRAEEAAMEENHRLYRQRKETLDFMRFLVASMCRVDEVRGLRFRDCRLDKNEKGHKILICLVTGKRGSRTVVALPEAASIYAVRLKKAKGDVNALMFPEHHRDAFRELLKAAGLHRDAQGFARNFKSLRATSISRAVLAGIDLMLIARNAGTSVAMIDNFYARRLSAQMGKDVLTSHYAPRVVKGGVGISQMFRRGAIRSARSTRPE